jgi:lactate racemase
MRLSLPYLDRHVALDIPDGRLLAVARPNEVGGGGLGAVEMISAAVQRPMDAPPLAEFLAPAERLLVIVNDATRPTPTPAILDAVGDRLAENGARFLVGTGAHRGPTEAEYRQILGRHYDRFRKRIEAHDSRDRANLVDLGRTRNGTPVLLNRALVEADRVVATGSVEPHYFAGYTGGRKAFLPGVAGFETIESNHRLALDPRARALSLADNPVSQDMDDALRLLGSHIFSIMTVQGRDQGLSACLAGDITSSFAAAVEKAKAVFAVRLPALADIVITVARKPMDIDLYQAQKAIDNGSLALADGGILILVASCRDGVGDRAYLELLGSSSNPEEALKRIGEGYRLGYHKAGRMAQVAARATVRAISELDEPTLRKAFMAKRSSLQQALDEALAEKGPGARVTVLPDGTVTLPLVG